MIVSVPDRTCGTLPDTGASSMAAPRSRARSARARLTRGLTVLTSTQIERSVSPARIPSGPDAADSSAESSGSDVTTTSAVTVFRLSVKEQCALGASPHVPFMYLA
jgi:hypothetical protein